MKSACTLFVFILIISSAFSHPFKGSGTKSDPFQITNIYELQEIQNLSIDSYFILMNDIDATETRYWDVGDHDGDSTTPDEPQGFMPIYDNNGSFDGNGHVIYNLYINRPYMPNVAFIRDAWANSLLKRLGLENCYIVGLSASSLCGNMEEGVIEECYTTGSVISKGKSSYAAGFCGVIKGDIYNCYTTCSVSIYGTNESDNITFAFGLNVGHSIKCYAAGKIENKKALAYGPEERGLQSFWDKETTGITYSTDFDRAKGLPTSEMKKRSTFEKAGWDFDSTWCIDEGNTYPRLKIFNRCKDNLAGAESNQSNTLFNLEVVPNPSSKTMEIKYSLSQPCNVSLNIINSLGMEELSLVSDEFNQSGQHSVTFDASVLSSGLYFCTIKAGGFTQTKQIVVIK